MTVSFTLTLKEFRKFQRNHVWSKHKIRLMFNIFAQLVISIFIGLFVGAPITMVYWMSNHEEAWKHAGVLFWVSFLVSVIFDFVVIRLLSVLRFRRRTLTAYRSSVTQRTITISSDFLLSETKMSKTEYKWEAVTQVVSKPDLIVVYLGKNAAVVVPTRAFQSQQEVHDFVALIDQYRNVSQT